MKQGFTTLTISKEDGDIKFGTDSNHEFIPDVENLPISVAGGEIIYWIINATTDGNGTITPSGQVKVLNGTNQTFTFTPNTGYTVADVKVDGVSVGIRYSYTFTNVTTGPLYNPCYI